MAKNFDERSGPPQLPDGTQVVAGRSVQSGLRQKQGEKMRSAEQSGRLGALVALLGAMLALLLTPGFAQARPGQLDPSFGHGGKAIGLAGPPDSRESLLMAAAPQGQFVALYGDTLLRYDADGRLDRHFGRAGRVDLSGRLGPSIGEGITFDPAGLAVDSENRILVDGTTRAATRPVLGPGSATIVRLLSDGRADPHFGSDGVLTSKLGFPPPSTTSVNAEAIAKVGPYATEAQVEVTGLTVDGYDRPIVSGEAGFRLETCYAVPGFERVNEPGKAYLARLTDSGQLDPSFGQEGVYAANESSRAVLPMVRSSDELEYLSTNGDSCSSRSPERTTPLVEIAADGSPQATFNQAQAEQFQYAGEAAEDHKGRTLLLGQFFFTSGDPETEEIARVNRLGVLDPSFAGDGHREVTLPPTWPKSIGVDSRGRPLLVAIMNRETFWLRRMTVSGGLDRSFGHRSEVQTRFPHYSLGPMAFIIDSRGRIVIASASRSKKPADRRHIYILLARYLSESPSR